MRISRADCWEEELDEDEEGFEGVKEGLGIGGTNEAFGET